MPHAIRSTLDVAGWRTARAGLATLGLAVLLGAGCSPNVGFEESSWRPVPGPWLPGSASPNTVTADSLTAQRVRGVDPEFTPVLPESGNVWPERELERSMPMSGPDEAMRNIPAYAPSLVPSTGAPLRSPVPTPGVPGSGSPGGLGAGLPPPPSARVTSAPPVSPTGGVGLRPEGQVTLDPSGRPAVTTGQAGNVRGFTQPGVGGGAVIRDGNVETWIGPDGQARTRVVPR